MSSASSGRYHSRLFNFVHQQSRRLTQQCDRAFRNLQVTAGWAVSVGLYPLLLMFQSTRSSAKQLHQAVKQSFPQLSADDIDVQPETPPTVDTPIQRVLLLVDALSSEEAVLTPSPENTEPLNNQLTRWFAALGRLKIFSNKPIGTLGDRSQESGVARSLSPHPLISPSPYQAKPLAIRHQPLTTHQRPLIQGIATQLPNRTLVLVTTHNEILDILTSWQQQKLQQQIIAAVADYWRYQRLTHSLKQQFTTRQQLPILKKQQLGARSLRGELIRHTCEPTNNLVKPTGAGFSRGTEEQNSREARENYELRITNYESRNSVLAFLDRTVAKVESNHLIPVSAAAKTSLSFANALGKSSWQLVQRLQTHFSTSPGRGKSPAITPEVGSEPDTLKLQALIWAAINYFFGTSGRQHLEQTTLKSDYNQNISPQNLVGIPNLPLNSALDPTSLHSQEKRVPQRRSAAKFFSAKFSAPQVPSCQFSVDPNLEDPWLSESDLFGGLVAAEQSATEYDSEQSRPQAIKSGKRKTSLALPSNQLAGYSLQNFVNSIRNFLFQAKPVDGIVKQQKINKGKVIGSTQQSSPLFKSPQQLKPGEISAQASSESTQMQPAPDWIETNATMMGYVKHPLEQLLEWLDRAMLWLEEVLLRVWQWVQQMWHLGK